jgi:hypothetical protein
MKRRELIAAIASSTAGSLAVTSKAGAVATEAPRPTATTAEQASGVAPADSAYPEGDIRRYGATVSASDNSAAVNAAMKVSANGGSPAFVPPGLWRQAP